MILIAQARFYDDIATAQLSKAEEIFKENDIPFEAVDVPGALEIPQVISFAASSAQYAGYLALGCVVRGETSHYDIVANESARALQTLCLMNDIVIVNGILTVENKRQALARLPKAADHARTCIHLIDLKQKWQTS